MASGNLGLTRTSLWRHRRTTRASPPSYPDRGVPRRRGNPQSPRPAPERGGLGLRPRAQPNAASHGCCIQGPPDGRRLCRRSRCCRRHGQHPGSEEFMPDVSSRDFSFDMVPAERRYDVAPVRGPAGPYLVSLDDASGGGVAKTSGPGGRSGTRVSGRGRLDRRREPRSRCRGSTDRTRGFGPKRRHWN
jgi:hypothetical protein